MQKYKQLISLLIMVALAALLASAGQAVVVTSGTNTLDYVNSTGGGNDSSSIHVTGQPAIGTMINGAGTLQLGWLYGGYGSGPGNPIITGVNPATAAIGDTITISGTNFETAGTVTIGGIAVTPTSWSDTTITVTIPAGVTPGIVSVVVTTTGGSGSFPITISVVDNASVDDNGLVRGCLISREADQAGKGIILAWDYSPNLLAKQADIWRLAGVGTQFATADPGWTKVASALTTRSWMDNVANATAKVGDGNNAYYRIVPAVTALEDIFLPANNARTLGKVDLLVAGVPAGSAKPYKYSFISHPFLPQDSGADAMIGKQLVAADAQASATELWGWTGTTFGAQEYLSNAGWKKIGSNLANLLVNGECAVVKTKEGMPDKIASLVGVVRTGPFGPKPIAQNLYTFLGDPYPYDLTVTKANLTSTKNAFEGNDSGLADQLWGWTGDAFGQQSFLKKTTGWQKVAGFAELSAIKLGQGYIYRRNPSAPETTARGINWELTP